MYVPAVDPRRALGTYDHKNLTAIADASSGPLLLVPTLAERLHARGARLAAVSSGSTGSAWLLNPKAASGIGTLVNGYLEPGKIVAYPPDANAAILAAFGPAPAKGGARARYDASVAWTQRVLREYVLPVLRPTVVINWLTEPDHSQHHRGVGSAPAREAIRNDDREIALTLQALHDLGLGASTDVFVVSDHGFSTNTAGVDVVGELVSAGCKRSRTSNDVVLASSGQAVALYVQGHDGERIARLVRFVQSQDWAGVVFTAGRAPGDVHGAVDGTFALALIHAAGVARGPDVIVTFPWTSRANAFGVSGTDRANVAAGATPLAGDHGSMSPWNVRNTFIAWGADFKQRTTVRTPVGNVDVTPTILALLGMPDAGLDGRVLTEALANGPDPEQVVSETTTYHVQAGPYRAALQASVVDGRRYIDKSWRIE
jgi:hypothetical protein